MDRPQQYKTAAEAERAEQLKEQVTELSTIKATKEEAISTIKKTGKHAIDWVTGKTRRKEKAAKEQTEYLKGQVITAREIGQQEGRQSVLQEIIQAARVRFEDLTPENVGRSLAHWISKANRLEQEVRTLKEAAETTKQEKLQIGRKQYPKGLNIAQTQIKGLQEDVYELIRNYANGDPNVILHYSIPREDRLRKEQERQEAERKKREQEGSKDSRFRYFWAILSSFRQIPHPPPPKKTFKKAVYFSENKISLHAMKAFPIPHSVRSITPSG